MIQEIEKMPIINFNSLKIIKSGVVHQTLKDELSSFVKKGKLLRLKKGIYVSSAFLQQKKQWYDFFVANALYEPSYISTTTALSYYNILTESSFGYTSVSPKKTIEIKNNLGCFDYRSIKESLFCGYRIFQMGDFSISLATKAKALFDFFRYRKKQYKTFTESDLISLRLNLQELHKRDIQEFKRYSDIAQSKRMKSIYFIIQKQCEKNR